MCVCVYIFCCSNTISFSYQGEVFVDKSLIIIMSLTQFLSLTAAHRLALQTIHAFLCNWNARGVNRTERARPGRSESSTHSRHLMCYCHISGMRHPCTQPLACHFRLIQATKKTDYWHRHHYLTPHSSPISSIL